MILASPPSVLLNQFSGWNTVTQCTYYSNFTYCVYIIHVGLPSDNAWEKCVQCQILLCWEPTQKVMLQPLLWQSFCVQNKWWMIILSSGVLDDMEHSCYCQLFDHITQQNPPQLDLIGMYMYLLSWQWLSNQYCFPNVMLTVYLRSSPEVCYRRLLQRGRKEEKPVTLVSEGTMCTVTDMWHRTAQTL